ncbi:hypothetical protein BN11_230015 [Nostocoides australiense Ben110]|uniref:Polysaccharide pyruvyl transferase domain-containing protein n=1 Tax=Nostocoides australiense Ben110 TaxID=1193182 RepID=W6K3D2_9MICO|nr:hypothetical protein BN11_230015 [Tetrasphaera australiensis Ben110]
MLRLLACLVLPGRSHSSRVWAVASGGSATGGQIEARAGVHLKGASVARLEKVGLVSLGEAGNLGDDLILIAAVQAISDSGGARTVKYLSHGQPLPWEKIRGVLDLDVDLEKSQRAKEYAFWREASRFRDCDAIVLGGGGLLQDVHHPVRPYQWMQYCDGDVPTLGVGLGLGPLGRAVGCGIPNLATSRQGLCPR